VVRVRPRDPGIRERDDGPASGGQIVGESVNEEQRRDRVDGQRLPEIVATEGLERRTGKGSAGDDDVVDATDAAARAGHDRFGRGVVEEIGADERNRGAARSRELRGERFELRAAPGGQDDAVAAMSQRPRNGDAETSRGADDEHPATSLHACVL
jgi:hypothetical protein